jgi:hypothetical protein
LAEIENEGDGQRPHARDAMLNMLLSMAEVDLKISITVIIGSQLVSGKLVGRRKYFEEIASGFGSARVQGDKENIGAMLSQTVREMGDVYPTPQELIRAAEDNPGNPGETYEFIHLTEAKYVSNAGSSFPEGGTAIRAPVSAVSGYSMGMLVKV